MKRLLLRVPEVTIVFWIIKVLSTTVGETAADYLSFDMGFGMPIVALIMSVIMAILLYSQFYKYKRYVPEIYWSVVVLMSIVGTLVTDILVDTMGVSLMALSIVFTITMIIGFVVWYRSEKTLSIHSIDTAKREMYYWIIILLAFALGTGVGDLLSEKLALGYGVALILFAGLIGVVCIGFYALKMNADLAFWLAFILTRPLGASLGDFMTQARVDGGLGLSGTAINSLFFLIIIGLVAYLSLKQRQAIAADTTDIMTTT